MEPVQTFRSAAELSAWLDGEEDVDLDNDGQEQPQHRAVRWINVEGIDVATIRVLGLHYQLHPLAIEDFTTFPPLIKVDYYSNLLFMNLVLTALDDPHHGSGWFSDQPDVEKPEELHRYHRLRMWQESAERQGNFLPRKRNGVGTGSGDRNPGGGDKNMGNYPLMYSMRAGKSWAVEDDPRDRMRWCNVAVKPVAFFLHRSSTLISIFAEEADEVVVPVVERLLSPQTLLRKSEDVSFLMEALLDGIVDRIVEVVEEYADELENMERKVFRKPKQIHTRQLHLILLELHALRRVLTPLTASVEQMRHSVPKSLGGGSKKEAAAKEGADEGQTGQFRAVSRLTQFYLGDVLDHLKFALEELSTLETRITDLTSLIFNTISHEQNRSMRLLSLVSLIFLPLTFVAGI
ncbi:hypothetical protein DFJ74DRAFT_611996 [Hyaloraphidium curvatum]|nr:hypothetical protein DFJ74DRAFT_611996 [Hyaloraphidium curvatum]